jgi:hypothetical protein
MDARFFLLIPIFTTAIGCVPQVALDHDNSEVERLMNDKQLRVENCYDHLKTTLARSPKGSLTIRAEHNPDGTISSVSLVKGFPGSQPLYECIRNEIQSSKTAPPMTRGPIEMTWNFH